MMKASGSKTTKNWSKTSKKIETRTAKPVKKVLGPSISDFVSHVVVYVSNRKEKN